ncbi:carbohydrate binding domain-containing protein [Weeksellaceae bacterium KMM 9713]|uniref:Carbohydrate binding domain-containing protein n=1 Tax=Profundicola chukchiensis TaxID=2961959 RepID=A0A9X4N029_9FLAO|nr:Calx-beta domain-containing protein [Profundicola chukchiensis]MDG4946160.1 carbohydrate binding domain-containing protein [Profundicola chukchiensis]
MKRILFSLAVLAASMVSSQVLIDDTGNTEAEIHESAALQINSNDKGLLLPRLAEEPQNAVGGLVYFDTNGKCLKAYDGTAWQVLGTECAQLYTVSISLPERVYEGEDQIFNVSISPAVEPGTSVSIEYITSEIPGIPLEYIESATEDEDYVGSTGILTFNEGETNKTISISTIDDDIVESSEHYAVIIDLNEVIGNANVTISHDEAEGVILDNDEEGSTPTGTIILNGGFESWTNGIPDDWTTIDSGINLSQETSIFSEGNSSLRVDVTTETQGNTDLRQSIDVEGGKQYLVSVDVYQLNSDVKARLYVADYENYSDSSVIGSWQTIENTYEALNDETIEIGLRFYDQTSFSGNAEILIDNFKIVEL